MPIAPQVQRRVSPKAGGSLQEVLDILAMTQTPLLGDVAGLLADANAMRKPENRTVANLLMAGAGALPLVPSLGGIKRAATKRFYHGTGEEAFKAFDPNRAMEGASGSLGRNYMGPGTYLTRSADRADEYRDLATRGGPWGSVLKVDVPTEKYDAMVKAWEPLHKQKHVASAITKLFDKHGVMSTSETAEWLKTADISDLFKNIDAIDDVEITRFLNKEGVPGIRHFNLSPSDISSSQIEEIVSFDPGTLKIKGDR